MDERFWCQGRWLEPAQVQWLAGWIALHPDWSCKRLAQQLCRAWHWRDGCGRLKDFAARRFLLKLQQRGLIRLPPVRPLAASPAHGPARAPARPAAGAGVAAGAAAGASAPGGPGTAPARRWAAYLQQYHYLGLRVVGENLRRSGPGPPRARSGLLVVRRAGLALRGPRPVPGLERGAAPGGLSRLANNTRFLLLPGVRVPHLASHLLGRVARRIQTDWRRKYGHGLDWLETFVEGGRFAGTSYRAANWIAVGQTTGRSRQDAQRQLQVPRKTVWLYRLAAAAPAPPPTVPRS